MREYLLASKKVLMLEIKYDLSTLPEEQLLTVVLVNDIHWVSHVTDTTGCITWVTFTLSSELLWRKGVLLQQMRNERLWAAAGKVTPGNRDKTGTWFSLSPNPTLLPFQAASQWTDIVYEDNLAGVCVCVRARACTHGYSHIHWMEKRGFAK